MGNNCCGAPSEAEQKSGEVSNSIAQQKMKQYAAPNLEQMD